MAEGLTGKFKDFAKNVSFNDYSEYTEHLSTNVPATFLTYDIQTKLCQKSCGNVGQINYKSGRETLPIHSDSSTHQEYLTETR